ncbi:hypothetical protein ABW20_dc0108934 [Dactylellina cionopaga]|nr:hypothetical protein ABW20_dc0108934 [Dactylellina cionopaga]
MADIFVHSDNSSADTSSTSSFHGTRTARYDLQVPIQSLSASPDQDLVVVAGREVLKILKVSFQGMIVERLDLRAGNTSNKVVANSDVKWGCNFSKDVIATANTNGNICVYDLNRGGGGKLDRVMHEHQRSVHRIAFNPGNGRILISGSQDGMMKIWDLRQKKSTMTLAGKSDAVRDVQFNTANAMHFAAAFDNCTIQKWEWRMQGASQAYLKKISAHTGPVFSIDWHPDGKHVASGGRDRTVKVWDFGDSDSQNKRPVHTISTMAAIGRATWRPRGISSREIATCSMTHDNRITVWDLKRPFVGKYSFDEHTNATSGLLWKDENTLWSCSKDQMFVQHDLLYAGHPINALNHSAVAWAPDNSFLAVMGQRPPPPAKRDRNVRFEMDDEILTSAARKKSSGTGVSGRVPPKVGVQQSGIDCLTGKYVPQQAVVEVGLPMFSPIPFVFMANNWANTLSDEMTLSEACQRNAEVSWHIGQFRTAQTWKMLDLIQSWEIEARTEEEERLKQEAEMSASKSHPETGLFAKRALGVSGTDRKSSNGSASATPLAKPVADTPQLQPVLTPTPKAPTNPPGTIDDNLSLPPKAFGTSVSSSTASTNDGEILNMVSRRVSVVESPPAIDENKELSLKPAEQHESDDKITPLRSDIFSTSPEITFNGDNNKRGTEDLEAPDVAASSSFDKDRDKASLAYRGRQYSIGLTSEQTSSSYDDSTNSFGRQTRLGTSHPFHKETSDDEDEDDHRRHHHQSNTLNPAAQNISSHNLKHQHQLHVAEALGRDIQDMVKDYGTIRLKGSGYGRMKDLPWNLQNFLTVLTDYYSDRGEVQMCATLALLFGELVEFDERRMGDWIEGYVEQLHRFKLYVPAAEVIKATSVEHVRAQALTNTFIHLSCGNCNAPMMSGGVGVGGVAGAKVAAAAATATELEGESAGARQASYKGSLYWMLSWWTRRLPS